MDLGRHVRRLLPSDIHLGQERNEIICGTLVRSRACLGISLLTSAIVTSIVSDGRRREVIYPASKITSTVSDGCRRVVIYPASKYQSALGDIAAYQCHYHHYHQR